MLLSPEMMLHMGPPPQAVLDQRWLWQLLLALLGQTFALRLIGLDVAGALLSGLMLCFGVIMTRDAMQEMPKYALVYAVLCGLNLFFDVLPLVTEIGGRITRTTEPIAATSDGQGTRQMTFTLTTRTTPFFDGKQGIVYNAQSMAMVLSPICMALGLYLAISAHNEIQRQAQTPLDEDFEDLARVLPEAAAGGPRPIGGLPVQRLALGGSGARDTFERFHGQGHRLGD